MAASPWILFGAFDRHNFGDLLLGQVAAALAGDHECVLAGLAGHDLRPWGGHAVRPIATAPAGPVLHVGGEVLACDAWTVAAMLLPPAEAAPTIAYLAERPAEREAFTRRSLGTDSPAPYAAGGALAAAATRTAYFGVGGVDLDIAAPALRTAVAAQLRAATWVGVRDRVTRGHLEALGVRAALLPDPAVLTPRLFAAPVARCAAQGEVAQLRAALPGGYLAVQCSGEFADDATLDTLARAIDAVARDRGWAVVLFAAGLAPWHDDPATLLRLADRLAPWPTHVLRTAEVFGLCALLSGAAAVAASSLHARIVAHAFAVPAVTLRSPQGSARKHEAYARTWFDPGHPDIVAPHAVPGALLAACARRGAAPDPAVERQARRALRAFAVMSARLSR